LVHGTVTATYRSNPKPYGHAWVEKGGMVYDWQTMVSGFGGNYRGKGWPIDDFYETFIPTRMKRYNARQAGKTMWDSTGGRLKGKQHYGPWH